MDLNEPRTVDIVRISDPRGNLSVLEYPSSLPFEPARVSWIHEVPSGMIGGAYACYKSSEMIVALSGSLTVTAQSVNGTIRDFTLNRPDMALIVPPMTWRDLNNFATNTVALIISDTTYNDLDIIRDKSLYDEITNDEENEFTS